MIKAAFITDAPRVAGSEIWLLDVLPQALHFGILPTVWLADLDGLNDLAQRFQDTGVNVFRYGHILEATEHSHLYDVCVLQAWEPATYGVVLPLIKSKGAVYVHDQLEYNYPWGLKELYRTIYRYTKANHLKQANLVMIGTQWASGFLQQHFQLNAKEVLSGVDAERFFPVSTSERLALRHKYNFERFTCITPARFALEKNHLTILQLAELAPDIDFMLVGSGELSKVVQKWITWRKLSNVYLLGQRWDMPDLYRAADALLFPTLADNPGLVLLEAMSSGLPVITSHFTPQAEIIDFGQQGLMAAPTAPAMLEQLRLLQNNPELYQHLQHSARDYVCAHRSVRHTAEQLATVLKDYIAHA